METFAARIDDEYRAEIPLAIRHVLHLQPQDDLLFLIDGDTVRICPRPSRFTEALEGLHKHLWPDPDAWLEEERGTWD